MGMMLKLSGAKFRFTAVKSQIFWQMLQLMKASYFPVAPAHGMSCLAMNNENF